MSNKKKDRLPRLLFTFAILFLTFGYGLVAGIWQFWPAPQVAQLYRDAVDLQRFWKNDYGLEPSRHLVTGYADRKERFRVLKPDEMVEGYLLVAGLTPNDKALNSAILFDTNGQQRHEWSFDYSRFADDKLPVHVFLHGLQVLPNGDTIFNFDAGNVLARMSACGDIKWDQRGDYHHVVTMDDDGSIWTLRGSSIVHAEGQTGKDIHTIGIINDIIKPHQLQGIMALRTNEHPDKLIWGEDAFHPNHVEPLSHDMAQAFPMFNEGDLLLSFRSLNMLAVLDPKTNNFKWHKIGPWHRQHNPHFMPDGTLLVYDNNMNFDVSKIMKVDPKTDDVTTVFAGTPQTPFYSWRRGKVQVLPQGKLLITESEKGRAFIVDHQGNLIWEYNNVYDDKRNGVLNKVIWLPKNYFQPNALSCDKSANSS